MKPNAKLHKENTDAVIKREEHYILVLEYVEKNFDELCCDLDKY